MYLHTSRPTPIIPCFNYTLAVFTTAVFIRAVFIRAVFIRVVLTRAIRAVFSDKTCWI